MNKINLVDVNFASNNTVYPSESIENTQFDWLDAAFKNLLITQFC